MVFILTTFFERIFLQKTKLYGSYLCACYILLQASQRISSCNHFYIDVISLASLSTVHLDNDTSQSVWADVSSSSWRCSCKLYSKDQIKMWWKCSFLTPVLAGNVGPQAHFPVFPSSSFLNCFQDFLQLKLSSRGAGQLLFWGMRKLTALRSETSCERSTTICLSWSSFYVVPYSHNSINCSFIGIR